MKGYGSTVHAQEKLEGLSMRRVEGILSGAVKCVDIKRNTNGESTLLAHD